MPIGCMIGYDATGGGVLATVTGGPSMTVPGKLGSISHIVAYGLDGTSVGSVTLTCTAETMWEAAGFSLKATANGTATSSCKSYRKLTHKIPIHAGKTLVMTGVSGAHPMWCILYIEYDGGEWKDRMLGEGVGLLWTRVTTASGTNTTTLVVQSDLVSLTGFGDRIYTPVKVDIASAYTTTAIIGLKKRGSDQPYIYFLLPLTNVAHLWDETLIPHGVMTITGNDTLDVSWLSVSTEQPTANITFGYAAQA